MSDDVSRKLIAWMDRELPEEEAAEVERHVRGCADCGARVGEYAQASGAFDEYCEALIKRAMRRKLPHGAPVLAGAAAIVLALILVWPRLATERSLAQTAVYPAVPPFGGGGVVAAIAPSGTQVAAAHAVRLKQRHNGVPPQAQSANWEPSGPAIEIAISGADMFPPGAVPDGVTFLGDIQIAADGSASGLSLRPRVVGYETGFERSANQP